MPLEALWSLGSWAVPNLLIIGLQVGCIVHIVRSGREYWWILIVLFLPVIGALVYLAIEVYPEFQRRRRPGGRITGAVSGGRLQALRRQLEVCDSVENRRNLAEAHLGRGEPAAALPLYEACLTPAHENDPDILFGLARAYFHNGKLMEAEKFLRRVAEVSPSLQRHERDLLLARTLAGMGRADQAATLYEALLPGFTGEEARYRYAELQWRRGSKAKARELIEAILDKARLAAGPYRRREREWIRGAKRLRRQLKA